MPSTGTLSKKDHVKPEIKSTVTKSSGIVSQPALSRHLQSKKLFPQKARNIPELLKLQPRRKPISSLNATTKEFNTNMKNVVPKFKEERHARGSPIAVMRKKASFIPLLKEPLLETKLNTKEESQTQKPESRNYPDKILQKSTNNDQKSYNPEHFSCNLQNNNSIQKKESVDKVQPVSEIQKSLRKWREHQKQKMTKEQNEKKHPFVECGIQTIQESVTSDFPILNFSSSEIQLTKLVKNISIQVDLDSKKLNIVEEQESNCQLENKPEEEILDKKSQTSKSNTHSLKHKTVEQNNNLNNKHLVDKLTAGVSKKKDNCQVEKGNFEVAEKQTKKKNCVHNISKTTIKQPYISTHDFGDFVEPPFENQSAFDSDVTFDSTSFPAEKTVVSHKTQTKKESNCVHKANINKILKKPETNNSELTQGALCHEKDYIYDLIEGYFKNKKQIPLQSLEDLAQLIKASSEIANKNSVLVDQAQTKKKSDNHPGFKQTFSKNPKMKALLRDSCSDLEINITDTNNSNTYDTYLKNQENIDAYSEQPVKVKYAKKIKTKKFRRKSIHSNDNKKYSETLHSKQQRTSPLSKQDKFRSLTLVSPKVNEEFCIYMKHAHPKDTTHRKNKLTVHTESHINIRSKLTKHTFSTATCLPQQASNRKPNIVMHYVVHLDEGGCEEIHLDERGDSLHQNALMSTEIESVKKNRVNNLIRTLIRYVKQNMQLSGKLLTEITEKLLSLQEEVLCKYYSRKYCNSVQLRSLSPQSKYLATLIILEVDNSNILNFDVKQNRNLQLILQHLLKNAKYNQDVCIEKIKKNIDRPSLSSKTVKSVVESSLDQKCSCQNRMSARRVHYPSEQKLVTHYVTNELLGKLNSHVSQRTVKTKKTRKSFGMKKSYLNKKLRQSLDNRVLNIDLSKPKKQDTPRREEEFKTREENELPLVNESLNKNSDDKQAKGFVEKSVNEKQRSHKNRKSESEDVHYEDDWEVPSSSTQSSEDNEPNKATTNNVVQRSTIVETQNHAEICMRVQDKSEPTKEEFYRIRVQSDDVQSENIIEGVRPQLPYPLIEDSIHSVTEPVESLPLHIDNKSKKEYSVNMFEVRQKTTTMLDKARNLSISTNHNAVNFESNLMNSINRIKVQENNENNLLLTIDLNSDLNGAKLFKEKLCYSGKHAWNRDELSTNVNQKETIDDQSELFSSTKPAKDNLEDLSENKQVPNKHTEYQTDENIYIKPENMKDITNIKKVNAVDNSKMNRTVIDTPVFNSRNLKPIQTTTRNEDNIVDLSKPDLNLDPAYEKTLTNILNHKNFLSAILLKNNCGDNDLVNSSLGAKENVLKNEYDVDEAVFAYLRHLNSSKGSRFEPPSATFHLSSLQLNDSMLDKLNSDKNTDGYLLEDFLANLTPNLSSNSSTHFSSDDLSEGEVGFFTCPSQNYCLFDCDSRSIQKVFSNVPNQNMSLRSLRMKKLKNLTDYFLR